MTNTDGRTEKGGSVLHLALPRAPTMVLSETDDARASSVVRVVTGQDGRRSVSW